MANVLRIKRRASGNAGAPASLANAELAFNEVDDILYYGKGTGGAGGTATTIPAIGGTGAFLSLSGTQTVSGNKTFTGDVIVTTQTLSDNSTKAASTAFVKGQGYLTSANAVTSVALSLPSFITVNGSPVTTTGTLTGTLANQTANTVFIAPDGSAGAPTFRSLVAADIPTLTAAKISDFDTQVRTSRLDQMAAPTASVALNSQRITGLADPSGAQDAATKAYVDALKTGLDVKDSVRAATTANITLSGTQTVDGVVLVANDRVLVKDQTTASGNGIYVVAAGAWTRALDADNTPGSEVTGGMFTFVTEGTVNADSGWVLTTNDTIVLGTTALSFAQFSGAGQITAGAGLTKTGNTLDVASTGGGSLTIGVDSINLTSGIATAGT